MFCFLSKPCTNLVSFRKTIEIVIDYLSLRIILNLQNWKKKFTDNRGWILPWRSSWERSYFLRELKSTHFRVTKVETHWSNPIRCQVQKSTIVSLKDLLSCGLSPLLLLNQLNQVCSLFFRPAEITKRFNWSLGFGIRVYYILHVH